MRNILFVIITITAITAILIATLTACNPAPATEPPPDEANLAATIAAAAEATATPDQEQPIQPTNTPPSNPDMDPVEISEENMAETTEDAANQAADAAQKVADVTADAAEDGTITEEEAAEIAAALTEAEEAIVTAETLIIVYKETYGVSGSEALALLVEMEEELETISQDITAILQIMEQGTEAASTAAAQLEAIAQTLDTNAVGLGILSQDWLETLRNELDNRAASALAVQPNTIPADRRAALQYALDYTFMVRASLEDGSVAPEELAAIAQAGANAAAGLEAHGGPRFQDLPAAINDLTALMARGDLGLAKMSVETLSVAIPPLP